MDEGDESRTKERETFSGLVAPGNLSAKLPALPLSLCSHAKVRLPQYLTLLKAAE